MYYLYSNYVTMVLVVPLPRLAYLLNVVYHV